MEYFAGKSSRFNILAGFQQIEACKLLIPEI